MRPLLVALLMVASHALAMGNFYATARVLNQNAQRVAVVYQGRDIGWLDPGQCGWGDERVLTAVRFEWYYHRSQAGWSAPARAGAGGCAGPLKRLVP